MKGSYTIQISTKRIKYNFTIHRNITIIQGNSATGKTTLVSLVRRFYEQGNKSGVKLSCDRVCMPLSGKDWRKLLAGVSNTIVFIDEGNQFIKSTDFAEAVKNSDNYYVIITREELKGLPYSINEIYKLEAQGGNYNEKLTYNSMNRMYGQFATSKIIKPTLVITEDSNAGYDFFQSICEPLEIDCIPAHGRDKIINFIYKRDNQQILIIGDGAAFGCAMRKVIETMGYYNNYTLYLPESFEWLVLKSGIVRSNELKNILNNPNDFIESKEFFSWERFFTNLLERITEQIKIKGMKKYNKNNTLPEYFKTKSNMEKILEQLPSNIKFDNTSN